MAGYRFFFYFCIAIVDLLATDKSRDFPRPHPIICNYLSSQVTTANNNSVKREDHVVFSLELLLASDDFQYQSLFFFLNLNEKL